MILRSRGMADSSGKDSSPSEVKQRKATANASDTSLQELAEMLQGFMESQAARDERAEREAIRQEQRWKSLQHQFRQLQQQVDQRGQPEEDANEGASGQTGEEQEQRVPPGFREPKLYPLTPEDNIEHFLATFERIAKVCRWHKEDWAIRLVPLLTGKARSAYVAMDSEHAEDYEEVKAAILAKYEITQDIYRQRFRALEVYPGETPRELYVCLKELFSKWVRPEQKSVKEISEMMILEQFLRMVNTEMEVWIKERNPKTAEEAAQLAEVFISARSKGPCSFSRDQHFSRKSVGDDRGLGHAYSRTYFQSRHSPPKLPTSTPRSDKPIKRTNKEVRCFYCGELGHTKPYCQRWTTKSTLLCTVPRPEPKVVDEQVMGPTIAVLINGQQENALVDTGSTQTLVRESLVPREDWKEDRVQVSCVHGDERSYPTAEIYLTVDGQTFLMTVAVVAQLPYPVVLGQDLPVIIDLLPKTQQCMIMTRAQSAREALAELPFKDSVEVNFSKPTKPKAQRRREKFLRSTLVDQEEPLSKPETPVDLVIPSNISTLQGQDPTLQPWFNKVSEIDGVKQKGKGITEEAYVLKKGILYQRRGEVELLVVPAALRSAN
ncbi:hypothetical protein SRHO_G00171430 [Serrasalmus rhombeus]